MNWKQFWQNYRIVEIKNDSDLLFQVGTTVKGKAISKEQFEQIISDLTVGLSLTKSDNLLDLCCGNGIITYELAKISGKVTGIDFSEPLLATANELKKAANIDYVHLDVNELAKLKSKNIRYSKVLNYGSLAYFTNDQFDGILTSLFPITNENCAIYIGGILDKERIWNFFNTPKRKLEYLFKNKLLGKDPGIGKWWTQSEIKKIADRNGYNCKFVTQNKILHTAHYRYDVVITKK